VARPVKSRSVQQHLIGNSKYGRLVASRGLFLSTRAAWYQLILGVVPLRIQGGELQRVLLELMLPNWSLVADVISGSLWVVSEGARFQRRRVRIRAKTSRVLRGLCLRAIGDSYRIVHVLVAASHGDARWPTLQALDLRQAFRGVEQRLNDHSNEILAMAIDLEKADKPRA